MPENQITLKQRQRIARDTMAFWFDTNGASYQFRAGQHADFAFRDPSPEHNGDNSRTFSLANIPKTKGK
jgi:ferredoxin-NADP reductase